MAAHARLSPSAASRWINCPGSVALCATLPTPPSTFYSDEGTSAHALAEKCILEKCDAARYLGWHILPQNGGALWTNPLTCRELKGFEVTTEMAEAVQMYLDALREPGLPIIPEQRLSLEHVWSGMFGTCDAQIHDRANGVLYVWDYKHGAGVLVAPDENAQAMLYAEAALHALKDKSWVKTVRIGIAQPRHRSGGVMTWDTTPGYIEDWIKGTVKPAALATTKKDAPLVPGEKQCRWCAAKAVCPALLGQSLEVAQVAFKDVITEPKTVHLPDPASMTMEQIANVLDFSELLSSWVSAVHAHAEQIARNGGVIPGRKLVRKTTRRKWIDEAATAQALAHLGDALYERKLKSPAQVEKLIKDKDAKKSLATLWENPEGELTLVPESDKRPAVVPAALNPFNFDDL